MTTKPTKYPDFAMNDVNDPASGQPNIIEPSAGKKSDGWVYNEKPPRQYFNWLARLTSQWVRWVDDYITNILTGVLSGIASAISALQGQMTTANSNISSLQSLTDANSFPRSHLQAIETGSFVGRLLRPGGTNVDITFHYTNSDGMIYIWWPDITISGYRAQRVLFQNTGTSNMPVWIRPSSPMINQDCIVGAAMYTNDENETVPPSGAAAVTHLSTVKVYRDASENHDGQVGCQLEFFKEKGQVWHDQGDSQVIMAGQVSYQCGNR